MLKPLLQLRWVTLLTLFLPLIFVVSCSEEKIDSQPNETNPNENLTEIERTEQALGVTLFKKDVTISDESGENTVTIRVASLDEDRLNE